MNPLKSLPTHLRRRLSFDELKFIVDDIVENLITPNLSSDAGDFVSNVCDFVVTELAEQYPDITPKDRDTLYYFFVDMFGKYLVDYYNQDIEINEEISRIQSMMD